MITEQVEGVGPQRLYYEWLQKCDDGNLILLSCKQKYLLAYPADCHNFRSTLTQLVLRV